MVGTLAMIIVGAFGVFCVIGGIIGYVKAGSAISLVHGVISGILLVVCSVGIANQRSLAPVGALVVTSLLAGRFLPIWFQTGKAMPAGIISLFSVITLLSVGATFLKRP